MDRHPRRHGQAVGSRRPAYHARLAPVALPVVCLAVALSAAWWGLSTRDGGAEPAAEDSVVADADGGDAPATDEAGSGDAPSDSACGSRPSRNGAFLDALALDAARSDRADDGVAARQAWTEERSLPKAAADVLRAYADEPFASLAMSGYLDIKGDVWGAIVRDARGWVDMVTCTAGMDDASCDVSVVRLMPEASDAQETTGSEGS